MASPRVRNSANVPEIAKVLRGWGQDNQPGHIEGRGDRIRVCELP